MTPRPELTEERISLLTYDPRKLSQALWWAYGDAGDEMTETILALVKYHAESEALAKESEQVPKEPLCQHCGFPHGDHQLRGPIAYCIGARPRTSWEPAP